MSGEETSVKQSLHVEPEKKKERRKSKRRKTSTTSENGYQGEDFPQQHKVNVGVIKQHIENKEPSFAAGDSIDKNVNAETIKERAKRNRKLNSGYDAVSECRKMFKREMVFLGKEVEEFRKVCQAEINKYKKLVNDHKARYNATKDGGVSDDNDHAPLSRTTSGSEMGDKAWEDMLSTLQTDMDFLSRKQTVLDREQELMDKEESLSNRQKELLEYEKEIVDVERMLDRRQEMCQTRQNNLLSLDEDLQQLRKELEVSKTQLEVQGINTESATERARHNWDIVRKNLIEKQTFLENTVQKYRTDLASAQTNITSKDLLLKKLQSEMADLQKELEDKNTKIKQLESRLTFTIDEARVLERKYQQPKYITDNGSPAKYNFFNLDRGDNSSDNASNHSTPNHTNYKILKRQQSRQFNVNNVNRTNQDNSDHGSRSNTPTQKIVRHEHSMHRSMELSNGESRYRSKEFSPSGDDKSTSCVVM